jgi:hypothetical protein
MATKRYRLKKRLNGQPVFVIRSNGGFLEDNDSYWYAKLVWGGGRDCYEVSCDITSDDGKGKVSWPAMGSLEPKLAWVYGQLLTLASTVAFSGLDTLKAEEVQQSQIDKHFWKKP